MSSYRRRNSECKDLTDKATYERLEKDVAAVKNDISALTDQITDALNSFAGTARSRPAAATSRRVTNFDSARRRYVGARQRCDGCGRRHRHSIEETLAGRLSTRPLATVGLALGLGFLIGATWRR